MLDKRASADAARNRRQRPDVSVAVSHAWSSYIFDREHPHLIPGSLSATSPPTRQIASQIATLARASDIARLHNGISQELAHQWWWYTHMPPKDWHKRTIKEVKCFQRLSHELCACLENRDDMTAIMLKLTREEAEKLYLPLKKLNVRSKKVLSIMPVQGSGEMGRPSLLRKGPGSFSEFTLHLLWDVRESGGRLKFEKNTGSGTLTKALETLRPHLPPNFIPKSLPLSTLWQIKQLDKKLQDKKSR
jgi:hypothetical protein